MVFGMMDDPGVIRRHMVGDKVEDEPQSAFTEHASCGCKPLGPPRCSSTT